MLESMMIAAINKQISSAYPHLLLPVAVRATISKVQEESSYYKYNLKILDSDGMTDERFPEVPEVKSDQEFETDDTVAILLCYGSIDVHIVGKAVI